MTAVTATRTIQGTFTADRVHSAFGFSVEHMGIHTFRGTLDDVEATLTAGPHGVSLEGAAKVESISIREPAELRADVLGPAFFDAENHPEVTFWSTNVELRDDGVARVRGQLAIAGIAREVTAKGAWAGPIEGPAHGRGRIALELETSFDRREFGFDWQMELPGGRDALGWDIHLDVRLELLRQDG